MQNDSFFIRNKREKGKFNLYLNEENRMLKQLYINILVYLKTENQKVLNRFVAENWRQHIKLIDANTLN